MGESQWHRYAPTDRRRPPAPDAPGWVWGSGIGFSNGMLLAQPGRARLLRAYLLGSFGGCWPGQSHAWQPQPRRLTSKLPRHRVNPRASWPLTGLDRRQAQLLPAARGAGPRSRRLLKVCARRHPGRRPGLQPQVPEGPLYHWYLQDGGDDLELTDAVRAVFQECGRCCESRLQRGTSRTGRNPAWLGQTAETTTPTESGWRRILVAWGGIEPPTQGFSVLCSTD